MNIKQTVGHAIGRSKIFFKKNGMNIGYYASIVGLVAGTALLIKKTFSFEDEINEQAAKILEKKLKSNPNISGKDIPLTKKEEKIVGIKATVKTYWLPTTIYIASLVGNCLIFNKQRNRIAGLSVALNGMTAAYNGVLQKIKSEMGEDAYNHFKFGTEKKEFITRDGKDEKIEVKQKMPDQFDGGDPYVVEFSKSTSGKWDRYNPANNWATYMSLEDQLGIRLSSRSYITNLEILNAFDIHPRNDYEKRLWETYAITGYRIPFKDEREKAWDEGRIVLPNLINYTLGVNHLKNICEDTYELTHMKAYPIQLGSTFLFKDPRLFDNLPR